MSGLDLDSVLAFDFIFVQQPDFFSLFPPQASNTKLSFWNIYLIVISEIDFYFFIFFLFCFKVVLIVQRAHIAHRLSIGIRTVCTVCRTWESIKGRVNHVDRILVMGARLYCSGKQFSTKVQAFLIALLNSLTLASQHIFFLFFLFFIISFLCDSFRSWRRWEWVGGEVMMNSNLCEAFQISFLICAWYLHVSRDCRRFGITQPSKKLQILQWNFSLFSVLSLFFFLVSGDERFLWVDTLTEPYGVLYNNTAARPAVHSHVVMYILYYTHVCVCWAAFR